MKMASAVLGGGLIALYLPTPGTAQYIIFIVADFVVVFKKISCSNGNLSGLLLTSNICGPHYLCTEYSLFRTDNNIRNREYSVHRLPCVVLITKRN